MKYTWRFYLLTLLILVAAAGLIWRMVYLNVLDRSFLLKQSDARTLRTVSTPAYRGMIMDRNGVPLAVSTPVDSVWVNPQAFTPSTQQMQQFAKLLNLSIKDIKRRIPKNSDREFVYIVRGLPPAIGSQIKDLKIPGVFLQREYRRYYPEAEITAHIIGFTNVDDEGQEGLELEYNDWLQGIPGRKQVIKDRLGNIVANLETLSKPEQGHNLVLSIDSRIQYLAYTALKNAVKSYNADSGSVVVLNSKTGEILAMVNLPSYNPNNRPAVHDSRYRNRAVTDVFEPGSTMKAFSVASALASGKYKPSTLIDTRPGWIIIDGNTIRDDGNYGIITVTQVLQKSSNIGVAKMTLSLPPENLWNLLVNMGFGQKTACGFPGEASGTMVKHRIWRPTDLATLAYGYGISVTALQLTQAYAIIAEDGVKRPVSFLKQDQPPAGKQAMNPQLATQMTTMLQAVAQGGTGKRAQIAGYTVAGKTGTAYIAGPNGYEKDRYESSFVGFAPVSNPQLVVAVILHGVHGNTHLAAEVAAPAFATIMSGALRYLNIAPDNLNVQVSQTAKPVNINY